MVHIFIIFLNQFQVNRSTALSTIKIILLLTIFLKLITACNIYSKSEYALLITLH